MSSTTAMAAPAAAINDKTWRIVFIFAFLILMVDGADLMFLSYSLKRITAEFKLNSTMAGSLGSATLIGMALGGIFGGWAADRFGRVRTLIWTVTLFSLGTAALGLTQDYTQFITARFISSLGLGAAYVVCNTLMAEYVPTTRRTTILGSLQAGWSVGYVVATLLSKWIVPLYGWRWLFFTGIIPVIMAFMMKRLVPEPQSWHDARERLAEQKTSGGEQKAESSLKMIFGNRAHATMFVLWALTAGFLQFGYYGVNNWLPSYLETELHMKFNDMTLYMVGTFTAMIFGKIVAGMLADKFGRRAIYAFGAMGTAVFLPVIVFYHPPEAIAYLLIFFGFLYGIPYGVNATYMTESFETKIRGAAVGGAYNVGRVGAALAPVTIGLLATPGHLIDFGLFTIPSSIGLGFLVMGAAYFFCGLVPALFIKEKLYDPQK